MKLRHGLGLTAVQVQENIKFSISRWETGVPGKIPVPIRQVLICKSVLILFSIFILRISVVSLMTSATSASDSTLLLQGPTE